MHAFALYLFAVLLATVAPVLAKGNKPLQVLPEDQRALSPRDSYVYLFVEPGEGADNYSLFEVTLRVGEGDGITYAKGELLGLVHATEGRCVAGSNTAAPVEFLSGGAASRLTLRLPVRDGELADHYVLVLKLRFFESRFIKARYFLGPSPDRSLAVEIFPAPRMVLPKEKDRIRSVDEKGRELPPELWEAQGMIQARLELTGKLMNQFIQNQLPPQPGKLTLE